MLTACSSVFSHTIALYRAVLISGSPGGEWSPFSSTDSVASAAMTPTKVSLMRTLSGSGSGSGSGSCRSSGRRRVVRSRMFQSMDFSSGSGSRPSSQQIDSPTFKPIRSVSLDLESHADPSPRATAPPMFFSELKVPDESEEYDEQPDQQQRSSVDQSGGSTRAD